MKKWRILPLFASLLLFLGGCGIEAQSTLLPQGEVAKKQLELLQLGTIIMVGVVLVVSVIFVYVIVKFRRKKGDENIIPEQVEGNHKLELIWTIIPILLLIVLAVPTVKDTFYFADTKAIDAATKDKDTLVINVTAHLFWWEFEYPDQKVVTSQDLYIPTDKKVYFKLKGADIKHAFWIPSLAGKMDVNTDNVNEMWITADKAGTYNGFCAEFCGPSHALMQFKVHAVSKGDFDSWVGKMQGQKGVAETATAKAGEEVFNKSCISCHAVDSNDPRPAAARIAPNLSNFGDRDTVAGILDNNQENVKKWIKDPNAVKPGNKMVGAYGNLTDDQINSLAVYLESLKTK